MHFILVKSNGRWRISFWNKNLSQDVKLTKKELGSLKWLIETELMTDDLNKKKKKL